MRPCMIDILFTMVSLYTSLAGILNSFRQLKSHPFDRVTNFKSLFVSAETSVAKLSPLAAFSMELVSLSTMKSSPVPRLFFTELIYKKMQSETIWEA